MKKYVDVIVPLPIANTFTYSLPESLEDQVEIGCRVVVPFGVKKYYTAIVVKIHYSAPEEYETKDISEVLDRTPVMLERQLAFWKWVAEYYLCTLGDVYKAALPSGMKLESETVVEYNPDFVADGSLSPKEQRILDILSVDTEQCITQIERAGNIKNILPAIKSLMEKDAIRVKEELKRNYKPKTEVRVRLQEGMRDDAVIQKQFDLLARAPKQLALLMKYIELSGWMQEGKLLKEVSKKTLLEASGASVSILNGLIDKHIFETYNYEIGRLTAGKTETVPLNPLNEIQQRAFHSIMSSFHQKNICLLHGVTASGKTEVYIHLIEEVIKAGKQVLYLLPEIALTTQITERLKRIFGSRIGVYHSKFPDAERVEIWQKQLTDNDYDVILGVRSSVFLPFRRLGLVIVDEEHETSYKQQDPAPRYHARDAAIMLAKMSGAKVLLGTATPAVETYHNVQIGKYGSVVLDRRYAEVSMPEIVVEDVKELRRKKLMKTPFSPRLTEEIREALARKEQVILFQNRRGYAPVVSCRACGWVPRCRKCDVCLTYHQRPDRLVCHYCGATYAVPRQCPQCGGAELRDLGYGTEKIEAAVATCFPEARTVRMDLDTTRSRQAYERIIQDFQQGHTDILIGTQMVTKGLDFDKVRVVGILNADQMMNKPDFRAYERAYQIMAQVAGRAGRRGQYGVIVVQTYQPDAPVIEQIVRNDYVGMYRVQMEERKNFGFPPFCRLINIYMKHRQESVVATASETLAGYLRPIFGDGLLGPERPVVGRVQAQYIRKIMVKLCPEISGSEVRRQLLGALTRLDMKSVTIYFDVDPV